VNLFIIKNRKKIGYFQNKKMNNKRLSQHKLNTNTLKTYRNQRELNDNITAKKTKTINRAYKA